MAKIQTEEHILIAVRGSLNEEIRVETIKLSEEDEDFLEGDDFGEYVDEILEDAAGAYEQSFCAVLTINSKQKEELIRKLGGFTRNDMELSFEVGGNYREESIEFQLDEIEEITEPNFVDWMAQKFPEEKE
jgi:hypothetical protein